MIFVGMFMNKDFCFVYYKGNNEYLSVTYFFFVIKIFNLTVFSFCQGEWYLKFESV